MQGTALKRTYRLKAGSRSTINPESALPLAEEKIVPKREAGKMPPKVNSNDSVAMSVRVDNDCPEIEDSKCVSNFFSGRLTSKDLRYAYTHPHGFSIGQLAYIFKKSREAINRALNRDDDAVFNFDPVSANIRAYTYRSNPDHSPASFYQHALKTYSFTSDKASDRMIEERFKKKEEKRNQRIRKEQNLGPTKIVDLK